MNKLYPYQITGAKWLSSLDDALLADDMGLGKSAQAIEVINNDTSIKTILVICPCSLKQNWINEYNKWFRCGHETTLKVINYDILKKHHDKLREKKWDLIIIDEVHFCKNPKAQRTKEALTIPCRKRIMMTGTPILNRPVELWPMLRSMCHDKWTEYWPYVKRYCAAFQREVGTPRGLKRVWDVSGASNLNELKQKLKPLMLRRTKAEVLTDLPEKIRQVVVLDNTGMKQYLNKERAAIRDYDDTVAKLIKGSPIAFEDLARARYDLAMAKLPIVIKYLGNAIEGSGKVVCFAHHKNVIAGIALAFPGQCVTLTGETPQRKRQENIDIFQNNKNITLFVGNIKAAGVGITLTSSSHVIFAELCYVPGEVTQAEDRCHRIGQDSSVLVQHLVVDGSLDANMAKAIVDKQAIIDEVFK